MIDNNELKHLIKHLVFSDKVANQADFASKLGYERSTISGMTSGKKPISEAFANKVCEIFDVNIDWLRSGQGEMLKENISNKQHSDNDEVLTGKVIPLYDAAASAGTAYSTNTNAVSLPMAMIEIGALLNDSQMALRVYGNSMIPNYPAGCIVGLRVHNDRFIVPGNVYVVETMDDRYIKRLYYNEDKTAFDCSSDNHMVHDDGPRKGKFFYPNFEIPLEDVRRLFKVVGVIKRNIL